MLNIPFPISVVKSGASAVAKVTVDVVRSPYLFPGGSILLKRKPLAEIIDQFVYGTLIPNEANI
jgi:hypothetical protein